MIARDVVPGARFIARDGPEVSIDKIRGTIGSLLLLWSDIERSVRQEITKAGSSLPKPGAGLAGMLDEWMRIVIAGKNESPLRVAAAQTLRAQLERQRKVRNGICHGLTGYSVGDGATPATLTWTVNGEDCSTTYQELQAAMSWLARVPRAMAVITSSPSAGVQSRITDNPENRAWWRGEFDIDLPAQR